MSTIKAEDLVRVYTIILRAQTDIDAACVPQLSVAWNELNQAQNILRVALESAPPVEIQEAA